MRVIPGVDASSEPVALSVASSSEPTAAVPVTDSVPVCDSVPIRADGLELLGEIPGSGYRQPPSLARRADGQVIQLTRLLYLVLSTVDGRRTYDEIASEVSSASGRLVSTENARMLVDSKLRTLGVVAQADGSQPEVKKANPLLALKFRYVVSEPDVTRRVTSPFARLFSPIVVAVILAAFVAICYWVLLVKGLASATHQAFDQPGLMLVVFAITVVSAGFHEFGHAAAARYGGATPGAMGAGLYLVWPAFYTDVTDSYRLGRAGRVRTDLGGLYFNAIVALAMFGIWWATGWDAVLLIIATQILQMLRQLVPLVRFDGYHVLADVTGVPDLYNRIKPTLLGLLPNRWGNAESKVLKPWARAVVSIWVIVVVPLLLASLVLMVLTLPRLVGTAMASVAGQWDRLGSQLEDGDALGVIVRVLSIVALALPVLGVGYILARVVRQAASGVRRWTGGATARRAIAGAATVAVLASLVWAWAPDEGKYRPIQAYERGTLADVLPATARTSSGLREGLAGSARTMWPAGEVLPTAASPVLSLVLVPRQSGAASPSGAGSDPQPSPAPGAGPPPGAGSAVQPPTWVFPFNRPRPPDEGDNQALAINTEDGSTLYDVAFALVWADGNQVLNANEAFAFASCTDCRTVAVGFQVILVLGQANVVVPQNLSGALNYNCVRCVTYALATQLVVTLPGPLSVQGTAALAAIWEEIRAFGNSIEDVPLSELRSRLTGFERQILDVIRADPSALPPASPTPADGPSDPPTGAAQPDGAGSTAGATGQTRSPVGASPTGSQDTGSQDNGSPDTGSAEPSGSPTSSENGPAGAPPSEPTTSPSAGAGVGPTSGTTSSPASPSP